MSVADRGAATYTADTCAYIRQNVSAPSPIPTFIKALSHQTNSHYVLIILFRAFEQVQSSGRPSLFRKVVAHPGSLY